MNEIVLLGGGGHSRVVLNLLEECGFDVLGYTAPASADPPSRIPYLGQDSLLFESQPIKVPQAAMGIGKVDSSGDRLSLIRELSLHRVLLPVIRSQNSIIHDDVALADATVVLDGATIITGSMIGVACIINTNATIDHDCIIGDDVHIAPGATLCGGVRIGASTVVGAGAVVIQSVAICESCIIGAGSTVLEDIDVPGTYVGSPARRIK